MKKVLFFCLCSFLSYQLLAQPFQKKQITNFDWDSRGVVIPNYPLGVSTLPNSPLFFEAHKNNSANVVMMNYEPNTDSFYNLTELTKNNFLNVNVDASCNRIYPNVKINVIWQTNENGNWDIAIRTMTDSNWSSKRYIANSLSDETNARFVSHHNYYFSPHSAIEVLYEKDNSIYLYRESESNMTNEIVFSGDSINKFSQPTGISYEDWFGSPAALYVAAVYKPNDTSSVIVYRYKAQGDSSWSPIYSAYDSGYCENPSFYNVYWQYCPLSFEKLIENKRHVYVIQDLQYLGQNNQAVKLTDNPTVGTSDLKMFMYGIVGKKENLEDYYFSGPHSFKLISNDSTYIICFYYSYTTPVMFYSKISQSKIGLGNLGLFYGYAVSYRIWEDSANGRVNLFGFKVYDALGSADDKVEVNNFELYQNYPNPFNPKTIIKYKLLDRDFVSLKVFDMLGNEISTLVNEEKEAGEHRVEFDASINGGLASGIYVYRLTVGKNYLTRKMILLK